MRVTSASSPASSSPTAFVIPLEQIFENLGATEFPGDPTSFLHQAFSGKLAHRTVESFVLRLRERCPGASISAGQVPGRCSAYRVDVSSTQDLQAGWKLGHHLTFKVISSGVHLLNPISGEHLVGFHYGEDDLLAAACFAQSMLYPQEVYANSDEEMNTRSVLLAGFREFGILTEDMFRQACSSVTPEEAELVFKIRGGETLQTRDGDKFAVPFVLLPSGESNLAEFWMLRVKYGKSGTLTIRLAPVTASDFRSASKNQMTVRVAPNRHVLVTCVLEALELDNI